MSCGLLQMSCQNSGSHAGLLSGARWASQTLTCAGLGEGRDGLSVTHVCEREFEWENAGSAWSISWLPAGEATVLCPFPCPSNSVCCHSPLPLWLFVMGAGKWRGRKDAEQACLNWEEEVCIFL